MYIWQRADWPRFTWDNEHIMGALVEARHKQGVLLGSMSRLGFELSLEAQLDILTDDAVKSSEIEGEIFQRESVRSSIARHLGLETGDVHSGDHRADGIVTVILQATERYTERMSAELLLGWHATLFSSDLLGARRIDVGAWRSDLRGPMQVVSGPSGRQKVHFEAVPAAKITTAMNAFIAWFNAEPEIDGLLRAALTHLWFITVHPFDDGNGRIARALTDKVLAQTEHSSRRFYSMSHQICKERSAYYDMLERTQKGEMDVTAWICWFLECFCRAIDGSEIICKSILAKAAFWERHAAVYFSERQKHVLKRLLDNFEGKITAKKWAILGKCSIPTAQRDMNELIQLQVLQKNPGGSKNTSFGLI